MSIFGGKVLCLRDLWESFFNLVGVVPVYRRDENEENEDLETLKKKNVELFKETLNILNNNESMVIFPEGTSYTAPQILKLKTGTSRLALSYCHENNIPITIVPVGLNYENKSEFRSSILIEFGKPIYPFPIEGESLKTSIDRETLNMTCAIKGCTINAPSWETLILIQTAKKIYMEDYDLNFAQETEMTKTFVNLYEKLHEKPEVEKLMSDIKRFREDVDSLNMKDHYFSKSYQKRLIFNLLIRKFFKTSFFMLISLPGFLIHSPLYLLGRLANYVKYKETISQTKYSILLTTVPLLYVSLWIICYYNFGFNILISFIIVSPLLGYFHMLGLQKGFKEARGFLSLFRLFFFLLGWKKRFQEIKNERDKISQSLHEIFEKETELYNILQSAPKAERGIKELEKISSESKTLPFICK